jgi:hypothetical protein
MTELFRPPLESVAYAKSSAHQRFIQGFEGQLRGRYLSVFLQIAGVLGGPKLRTDIERELEHPRYHPDQMSSARHGVLIFDRATRAGVSVERMGEMVMAAYKQANPEVFEGKSVLDAFELLEAAYRRDTTYGGVSPGLRLGRNEASIFRRNSAFPCAYFAGVIKGTLLLFHVVGSVTEPECQWQGAPSCRYDARWSPPKANAIAPPPR